MELTKKDFGKKSQEAKILDQLYVKYKKEKEHKENLSEVITEATSEIQPDEAIGLLDDIINNKDKNKGPENP